MKIHFIGIGGIGVSALAQYYLAKGHQISGSDLVSSEITETLKKLGAKIYIGKHNAKNLSKNVDLVIYSPAVSKDNSEFVKCQMSHIKCQSYPEALGELTKQYYTIAVSGTHGKSTTTTMTAFILKEAGLDPTVIVGTKFGEFNGSNCRVGKSQYLVIEACEHLASFLNYWPKIIVLTNIEKDHLDYYKNLKNILKTFKEYINHLPKEGILITNRDDRNILKILNSKFALRPAKFKILKYSFKQPETKKLKRILKVPGEHNVFNALAALAAARAIKIPDKVSFKALSEYKGSWRRFEEKELKIKSYKLKIISDYAHHPTEVRVTLKTAREKYPNKKIWCIFQPHQYQRTFYLFKDFVKIFKQSSIDKIIITDIYYVAGREEGNIKNKVNSKKLVKAIKKNNVIYLPKENVLGYLKKNLFNYNILLIMGAGDIYKLINFPQIEV